MAADRAAKSASLNFQNFTTKEPTFSRGRRSEKTIEIYWKELCCQEKSSQSRNKALLDDFERVEKQSAALEAQTEKLKQLKDQYEGYINSMYPRWLDELKLHKQRLEHNRNGADGQESQPQEAFRPNNVRFASPPYLQPKQESFLTSSDLYDGQNNTDYPNNTTDYPDSTYYQQTSIPHGTARGRTLDWDSYHRDSSLGFYHFGQVSSLRTPHGHFPHRNDYMRFSTPYNPSHIGPWGVATNGFNQSFDIAYHTRHPSVGSPIRYNGPTTPMNGYARSYNEENGHLVSESTDMSYQQPKTSRQQYGPPHDWPPHDRYYQSHGGQRQGEPPQKFRQEDRDSSFGHHQHVYQGRREVQDGYLQEQHVNDESPKSSRENSHKNKDQVIASDPPASEAKGPISPPSSPYDPPEKPLESTMDLIKAQPEGNNYVCNRNEDLTKKKTLVSPRHSLGIEAPEKLEQANLSAYPGSSLAFSDLEKRLSQPGNQSKTKQDIDQEIVSQNIGLPGHKQELNKKVLNANAKPVDNDNILDLLSDGTLSSGDDSELSHNDYVPSLMDVSNNGMIKTSNSIQIENEISTSDGKLKREKDIEKVSSKHSSSHAMENTSLKNEDNDSKSTAVIEQGGVDVTSLSREGVCPSVSVKGSLSLLRVIDADVEDSVSPETFYRAPRCSQEMRDDIIERVESGSSLDIYDPSVLSMVLLDELPKLTRASPSGGLISKDNMEYAVTEPQYLRNVIEPSLSTLWDDLMAHMVRLVEYNIMAVDEVSRLFSVSLLALDSTHTDKFQAVLAGLIRDSINGKAIKSHTSDEVESAGKFKEQQSPIDNHSVTSEESSTLESTPPPSAKQDDLPIDESPPTPQSLDRSLSYENDFEQEDDIPLTETAAYKKLMSTTESDQLGNPKAQEEESEGDDDLERTLARSISPPVVSPRQRSPVPSKPIVSESNKPRRQKPKLSIFSGGDSLGLSYGSEDFGDSWGGSSGRLSSTAKSDVTDKTASPPSSPDLDTGYIPTAMEDNKKKDDSVPKKSTRKPGFWNHSDTESEVDLQLSTGVLDDEDDDFDFYG